MRCPVGQELKQEEGRKGAVGKSNPDRERYTRARAHGRKACGVLERLEGSQCG